MGELLGTRALARALGVSAPAVTKAAREKRIQPAKVLNGRALFDLDAVRQVWSPAGAEPPADAEAVQNGDTSDVQRYNKARADREESLAAQEVLELEKMRGALLPRDEVALSFTQFLRDTNQSLAGLPVKLLSRYPGLTPEGREFLTAELRAILDDLGKWEPAK